MKKAFMLVLLGWLGAQSAYAAEEGVGQKVGNGIKKGGESAAHGIEKGIDATGRGVRKAVEATERGVKKGAEATGKGLRKAGEWIEEKVDSGDK
jgi:hypothetical protein